MGYTPQATIDHAALRHNLKCARKAAKGRKIWAVIKADGYGHGMLRAARTLKEADGFAVARLDEAMCLRGEGVAHPILVMGGCYTQADLHTASIAGLELALHEGQQVRLLQEMEPPQQPLTIWLKVDTGMHRLGFNHEAIHSTAELLSKCPAVAQLNLMTHLANADDRNDPATYAQCELFESIEHTRFSLCSIANSAGLLGWPASLSNWVRPGIMLYGASPFFDIRASDQGLLPVMTLHSRVIAVRHCRNGEKVGYGGSYICPEAMTVAVIAIGYGDGYPRHAPTGTPVLVGGQRLPLIGRVSMDMICVDARILPTVQVGDEVVLWGKGLPVEEIAERAGTIAYELLCGVKQRVAFIDQNEDEEG
ncbi:MAG: alanine racemase [Candidatus Thiodiazotropha sp. (ex Rostrolucina anterorostrata)]|nr:alanine racemase [Candidatus Thiodiazotropha sp. (ex Rostrolucina anterorostrata)]